MVQNDVDPVSNRRQWFFIMDTQRLVEAALLRIRRTQTSDLRYPVLGSL